MRLGDMLCPYHPGMTLFECRPLHEAVTAAEEKAREDEVDKENDPG